MDLPTPNLVPQLSSNMDSLGMRSLPSSGTLDTVVMSSICRRLRRLSPMPTQTHSSAIWFDSGLAMLSPTFPPSSHRKALSPLIILRSTSPAPFNRESVVAAVRRVAVWSGLSATHGTIHPRASLRSSTRCLGSPSATATSPQGNISQNSGKHQVSISSRFQVNATSRSTHMTNRDRYPVLTWPDSRWPF